MHIKTRARPIKCINRFYNDKKDAATFFQSKKIEVRMFEKLKIKMSMQRCYRQMVTLTFLMP